MQSEVIHSEHALNSPVFTIKTEASGIGINPKQFWEQLRYFYRSAKLPKGYKSQKLQSVFKSILSTEKIAQEKKSPQKLLNILDEQIAAYQAEINDQFKQKSNTLITSLQDLLVVDGKEQSIGEVYDFASDVIAFDKLSGLIPQTEGRQLTKSRSKRLISVLDRLKKGLKYLEGTMATVMIDSVAEQESKALSHCEVITTQEDLLSGVGENVRKEMDQFIDLIKVFRMAALEVDNLYKEEVHDEYFEHFSWYQLTKAERKLFHPFIVVTKHEYLTQKLEVFSELLSTNWPINFVVLNSQVTSPTDDNVSWEDAAHRYRQELSMFAIAHRNVFIFQTAISNDHIVANGVRSCLHSTGPSLAHFLQDSDGKSISGVSTICRYFPTINYNPVITTDIEHRLDLEGNEQPTKAWPEFELALDEGIGDPTRIQLPFTYADYKALFPSKVSELLIIPPEFFRDTHLVPLHEYLQLEASQLMGKVPYILLADKEEGLYKAAVPNVWVVSCQERLDFWQLLQVIGGVEKRPEASENTPTESKQQADVLSDLKQKHEQEIEKVREEATKKATEQLIGILLKDIG